MIVPLAPLLKHALKRQYGIPAFNISFQEQAQAVLSAAEETQSPVIIQFSKGGLSHAAKWFVQGVFSKAQQSTLPICLHRDHCHTIEEVQEAIDLGFSSIMMDGSLQQDGTPNSFSDNVAITQKAKSLLTPNISLEGELGCLGALSTGIAEEEDGSGANTQLTRQQMLTDPDEAKQFVAATGVDALAVAIGTSHGINKFSAPPSQEVLDISRVRSIHDAIPNTPLVLHGSSSVPSHLCDMINKCGGKLPKTYGVPVSAIQEAIQYGVGKINIDTDLRLAATAAVRQSLQDPSIVDPRQYLSQARQAMQTLCINRYQAFNAQHQATHFLSSYEPDTSDL